QQLIDYQHSNADRSIDGFPSFIPSLLAWLPGTSYTFIFQHLSPSMFFRLWISW
ncbi:hypothetical protein COCMIDRAFT_106967, partial [Bipolaris oryzae ATCC 44560]